MFSNYYEKLTSDSNKYATKGEQEHKELTWKTLSGNKKNMDTTNR